MNKGKIENNREQLWRDFITHAALTARQAQQFKDYLALLIEWNKKINLTAITQESAIITHHFQDSLIAGRFVDFIKVKAIADVGTGAGFPGVPLKIKYPHLSLILIEVNSKKIAFLRALIDELKLEGVEVCPLDWRTFLRKTDYQIDMFLARASLKPDELIRLFKPDYPYNQAQLFYWASEKWIAGSKEKQFIPKEFYYTVGEKKRKLVLFSAKSE